MNLTMNNTLNHEVKNSLVPIKSEQSHHFVLDHFIIMWRHFFSLITNYILAGIFSYCVSFHATRSMVLMIFKFVVQLVSQDRFITDISSAADNVIFKNRAKTSSAAPAVWHVSPSGWNQFLAISSSLWTKIRPTWLDNDGHWL